MSAVERELVSNLTQFAGSFEFGTNVLIVGAKNFGNFESILKSNTVFKVHDVRTLVNGDSTLKPSHFSALIVDNALDQTELFDRFVPRALSLLCNDGICLIRQNLADRNDKRIVAKLTQFLDVFRVKLPDNSVVGFDLYCVRNLTSSIYAEQNWMDFMWLLRKRTFSDSNQLTFRDFLDKTQYTDTGISAYEWIFGSGFISPGMLTWDQRNGGSVENMKFLEKLNIQPDERMLDVGVGIGGSALQVAQEYGAHVLGMDLSSNMVSIALERADETKDTRLQYLIADVLKFDFPNNSFDVVYSRDCIQHLDDLEHLFRRFFKWLKPGGRLLISAYARGSAPWSDQFAEYVQQRQYHLKSLEQFEETARMVGFVNVAGQDLTNRFEQILNEEITNIGRNRAEFVKRFSTNKYDDLVSGWASKLSHIKANNHCWVSVTGLKPK